MAKRWEHDLFHPHRRLANRPAFPTVLPIRWAHLWVMQMLEKAVDHGLQVILLTFDPELMEALLIK